ncbi:MAG: hypothetical protein U0235_33315 [Polyangiaceae bacterium]
MKSLGLSIVDWCDVSTFMGYHIYRTYAARAQALGHDGRVQGQGQREVRREGRRRHRA